MTIVPVYVGSEHYTCVSALAIHIQRILHDCHLI